MEHKQTCLHQSSGVTKLLHRQGGVSFVELYLRSLTTMHLLFTSASQPAALALARVLSAEGHIIHGADEECIWGSSPARFSRAYSRFYRLECSSELIGLWKEIGDGIEMIIPFNTVPNNVREHLQDQGANILEETPFHTDYEFQDFVRDHVLNVPGKSPSVVKLPASFTVHSRTCIAEILSCRSSATFSLQPAPFYDIDDEDTLVDLDPPTTSFHSSSSRMEESMVISCTTLDDQAVEAIKCLPISKHSPYLMIELTGGASYSAHALVNKGRIHAFITTANQGAERDFLVVSSAQPLFDVLLQFTERFVEALNNQHDEIALANPGFREQSTLSTHLTLTFRVKDEVSRNGDFLRKVAAVSCTSQIHPSFILLYSIASLRLQLALAYTKVSLAEGQALTLTLPTTCMPWGLYSIPAMANNLFNLVLSFAPWKMEWWANIARVNMTCWVRAVCYKENMWNMRDPGPALWLWFVTLLRKLRILPWIYAFMRFVEGWWEHLRLLVRADDSILCRTIEATVLMIFGIWYLIIGLWAHPRHPEVNVS